VASNGGIKGLVTIFGGPGFVGRHAVRALAKDQFRIRAGSRRPDLAGYLQPMGNVGQIQPVQANLRFPDSVRRAVEDEFGYVRVRGEISGYRGPHSSGHAYFALKDDRARIDAVIWKGTFSRLRFRPEEGMEVIATGKVTTFPGSSKYQIVIETMEPAGAGDNVSPTTSGPSAWPKAITKLTAAISFPDTSSIMIFARI